MPVCNIATAASLFAVIELEFGSHNIPWSNRIEYASDTASVLVGEYLSRFLVKQPKLFSLGCYCHLGALCSAAALKKLLVSLDNLLVDIFYHFKHSSNIWQEFHEMERCLRRLLQQWPALHFYFDRIKESESDNERVQRVTKHLKNPEVKLYCNFVVYDLKPMNIF